jgi:hypothetical protein
LYFLDFAEDADEFALGTWVGGETILEYGENDGCLAFA